MVGLDDLARPTCASLNHPCLYLEAEFGKRLASRRPNQLLKHWDGDLAPKLALVRPTGAWSPRSEETYRIVLFCIVGEWNRDAPQIIIIIIIEAGTDLLRPMLRGPPGHHKKHTVEAS